LLDEAHTLAARIAGNPPLAVQAIKDGLRRALDPDWASLGRWVSETLDRLFDTDDHREGVRSFLEKREPKFQGR
jgi:enoyl-CoA hydratase